MKLNAIEENAEDHKTIDDEEPHAIATTTSGQLLNQEHLIRKHEVVIAHDLCDLLVLN